jgi:hypothetical protein
LSAVVKSEIPDHIVEVTEAPLFDTSSNCDCNSPRTIWSVSLPGTRHLFALMRFPAPRALFPRTSFVACARAGKLRLNSLLASAFAFLNLPILCIVLL